MPRLWVWISTLVLTVSAGCDEAAQKPTADQKAPDASSKSLDHMRGVGGIAPPGGLE